MSAPTSDPSRRTPATFFAEPYSNASAKLTANQYRA